MLLRREERWPTDGVTSGKGLTSAGLKLRKKICHVIFPSGGTSFLFVCEICRIKAETKNFFVNYNHCKGLSHCI